MRNQILDTAYHSNYGTLQNVVWLYRDKVDRLLSWDSIINRYDVKYVIITFGSDVKPQNMILNFIPIHKKSKCYIITQHEVL